MLSDQQKADFCALMLQQYNTQINTNDELLPVYYIAYSSALQSENAMKLTCDQLLKTVEEFKITTAKNLQKLETKQYHFTSEKQAFYFALGKVGLGVLAGIILLFAGWVVDRREARYEQVGFLIDKSPIMIRQVNDSLSVHLIRLYPAMNYQQASAGKNYLFNKECNCIEVPLYFKNSLVVADH